jgi:hypothetical protein
MSRLEDTSAVLDEQGAVVAKTPFARREHTAVGAEPVAGGEDGGRRLGEEIGARVHPQRLREVGKICDYEIERSRNGLKELPVNDVHAVADPVARDILPSELDGRSRDVHGPNLRLRRAKRDRDCDGAGAGSDVCDPRSLLSKDRSTKRSVARRGVITRPGAVSRRSPENDALPNSSSTFSFVSSEVRVLRAIRRETWPSDC